MTPALAAGALAATLTLVGGGPLVGWLRRAGAVKSIREEAPKRHGEKAGTPTMGGLVIIGAVLAATLIVGVAARRVPPALLVALGVVAAFSGIGAADDILGILRRRNLGLRVRERLGLQLPVALLWGVYVASQMHLGSWIGVPGTHLRVDLGWGYTLFCMLFVVGMANAVNLTDGLDGLAAGSVAIAATALAILAARSGAVPASVLCAALAGATLGFLWFNAHPARVFMGDLGSQGCGALLAVAGILAKMELLVLIIGGLFVWEALSVFLQVAAFKTTGRRIFRMSPFHHHCELLGWTETQTVVRFWVCGALLAALGVGLAG
ncbi:MAG TPA: phospho-N-acetylmuramoyl-pentapeptide-transferase [bacterium]|nr:phospho-N-acetylmuramoyl-pentapeptide-transferase [bacterium]